MMKRLICIGMLGVSWLRGEEVMVDVVVYGATPGGIAAAVAAGELGAKVLLVEPTGRVGGLVTSGLSHTDFHTLESLSGTFLEFSRRVKAHYAKVYGAESEQVKASFEGTFGEPKVNLLVMEEMLSEQAGVRVVKETRLVSVGKQGARLMKAVFEGKAGGEMVVAAQVFVDGTYEGDLMAQAGVPFHVGREVAMQYGESLAPEVGDEQLQAYNFRFCATDDPANRVPIEAPEGYKRQDFVGLLPMLQEGKFKAVFGYPSGCIVKAHLPVLPNRKYDINDVSRGLVRLSMPGYNLEWPEGDGMVRQQVYAEHLRYNVGLLYFLQNDEAVPAKYREMAAPWGWCKDEFVETGHLPPQLYVREARRMIGKDVYVQADSEHAPGDARAKLFEDAIAMGDYGNNCHGTNHEGPQIGGQHGGEFYNAVPPYQIPYGVLVPKNEDCENLLVPVAVSSSHVGFCALRLEPIWMSLGQAAGHAAAMAAKGDGVVQKVEVKGLQKRLMEDGSALIYVGDVLPGDADFAAVQWWGVAGGWHGLNPMPEKPGQRGENLHGQYYKASPGHAVELEKPLDEVTRKRWVALAEKLGVKGDLAGKETRGAFLRAAFGEVEKGK